jgi:hypothetical protein
MAPEQDAECRRDADRDDGDLERDAGAVEHPGQDVAAAVVGAERVRQGWRQAPLADVQVVRVVRRDRRPDDRQDHQQADDRQPDQGQLAPPQHRPQVTQPLDRARREPARFPQMPRCLDRRPCRHGPSPPLAAAAQPGTDRAAVRFSDPPRRPASPALNT